MRLHNAARGVSFTRVVGKAYVRSRWKNNKTCVHNILTDVSVCARDVVALVVSALQQRCAAPG